MLDVWLCYTDPIELIRKQTWTSLPLVYFNPSWMWGGWMARLLLCSFKCGQVLIPSCGEGCRSFEPKGISHWIWLLWLPARLWSLTKQIVVKRWQISTASLELSSQFTLENHPTNTRSFYALGNKKYANLWSCPPMCNTVFGITRQVTYGTGFWSVRRRVARSGPASWLAQALVAMRPMSCCWPVGAQVKQEKRSPLLAFFV